ncbi:MAG: aminodeoxychorismate/anthranilate synthase component II [Desulfobacterales bacterium]|nr:aminodeoxychorismate/anthranilate synthase component II [Desulfobacterales bacterium]
MKKLLVIDNYDSFTYNLIQMFMMFPLSIQVHRSDMISIEEIGIINPDYILISPGPKDPSNAGISIKLIQSFFKDIPILGVCLGMQCINEAFGGETVKAPIPIHGKKSDIIHENKFLFKGVPSPFVAGRYHSLMSARISIELAITAMSDDGVVMGLSHKKFPLHGVQFHPESFLTEHGNIIINNFLYNNLSLSKDIIGYE